MVARETGSGTAARGAGEIGDIGRRQDIAEPIDEEREEREEAVM